MKNEFSLQNGKAIMNFSANYCTADEEVLSSIAFKKVLKKFFERYADEYTENDRVLDAIFKSKEQEDRVEKFIELLKIFTIMDSETISNTYEKYENVYEYRNSLLNLVEEIYTYWRKIERYSIIYDNDGANGISSSKFKETKEDFDKLILNLYRKISTNIDMSQPTVFRQVAAGSNVCMICKDIIWAIPDEYTHLTDISFVTKVVMDAPLIVYPKKNKRTGFFNEIMENPLKNSSIHSESFFAFPVKVGELLAFVFCHKDFITHMISLSNLFEIPKESEYMGKKPDIIVVMGAKSEDEEIKDSFYYDEENDIILGYIPSGEEYDYFGYMKKMMLTCHNVVQINRGNLPIHGAMVNIVLKDGSTANVVIVGDSGAGKSESIEAFRSLAEEHIADMTVIFDDMGTFLMEDETVMSTGTEIGAFVRLDDLDAGYAFKELDRSILMNPDKINARLIMPVSSYKEISDHYKIDFFLYANNYTKVGKNENSISFFKNKEEAIEVFKSGKRVAKGTTQEVGLTESYFANPFGPMQRQEQTNVLLDQYFDEIFKENIKVGELFTQLSIKGKEKDGPEKAALDLFKEINKLNKEKKNKSK